VYRGYPVADDRYRREHQRAERRKVDSDDQLEFMMGEVASIEGKVDGNKGKDATSKPLQRFHDCVQMC